MSAFTPEEVRKIAVLSRLEFTEEQAQRMSAHLSGILSYIEKLNELDTSAVEPLSHPLALANVLRRDERRASLTNAEALANAPESEDGCFKVPPIIQEM